MTTVCQHRIRYCPEDSIEGNIIQSKILSENFESLKRSLLVILSDLKKQRIKDIFIAANLILVVFVYNQVDSQKYTHIDSSY